MIYCVAIPSTLGTVLYSTLRGIAQLCRFNSIAYYIQVSPVSVFVRGDYSASLTNVVLMYSI